MEKDTNKPLVIVLSRNYSTGLSVVRSVAKAGYPVDMIASAHKPGVSDIAAASRYIGRHVEVVTKKVRDDGDEALLAEILHYEGHTPKPVLFPVDDYTVSVMDSARDRLEPHFLMPSIRDGVNGSMFALMDKTRQAQLAADAGIEVPRSTTFSLDYEEGQSLPEDITYPCFVKPLESISGYKHEMARCDDPEELRRHLQELHRRRAKRSVVIQEYLEIDGEIDLSGVCFDDKVIIPAIIRKTRVARYERGVTMAGVVVSTDELGEDLLEMLKVMMRSYHYTGMFDLEMTLVGDRVLFNEVNLRSGGPNYAYFQSGVNLPALVVNHLCGKPHTPEEERVTRLNQHFIYEKVAWEDYNHACITRREMNALIREADIRILEDPDDPAPYRLFKKKNRLAYLRGRARTVLAKLKEPCLAHLHGSKDEPQMCGKPRIVVVTRSNIGALGLVRSLAKAGYEVDAISSADRPGVSSILSSSRYLHCHTEIISPKVHSGHDQPLLDGILRYAKDLSQPVILLPADDYSLSVIDTNRKLLSSFFLMPHTGSHEDGAMRPLMSKFYQICLAQKAGLQVPGTWAIDLHSSDRLHLPKAIPYPCFVKPLDCTQGLKEEMRVCRSRKELARYLDKLHSRRANRSVLVQEYLEIQSELSLCGVCLDDQVWIPALTRSNRVAAYNNRSILTGVLLSTGMITSSVLDKVLEMLKNLHYTGLFDVELFLADDQIYFNEIHLHSSIANNALLGCGVNLPVLCVEKLLGLQPDLSAVRVRHFGLSFLYENIALKEYQHDRLRWKELKVLRRTVDFRMLDDPRDPDPYRLLAGQIRKTVLSRNCRRRREHFRSSMKKVGISLLERILRFPQFKPQNRIPDGRHRVLIAGRNYCSNLCMARTMGKCGYHVEVLHVYHVKKKRFLLSFLASPSSEAYSRYVNAFHVCITNKDTDRILLQLKELADPDRKTLLIATDDLVAGLADEHYNELKKFYLLSNVKHTQGRLSRLMDKDYQKRMAEKAGLPTINGVIIHCRRGEYTIPDSIRYPCFVKPNISRSSAKSMMRVCENREELAAALNNFRREKRIAVLVEDYIRIDHEFSLLGVCADTDILATAFFRTELGGDGTRRGVAIAGRTLPIEDCQPLIDPLISFLRSLHYTGLYDIDLIRDTEGNLYFVEINVRFGSSGYAFTLSDMNLPQAYAEYMFHGTSIARSFENYHPNQTFIAERGLLEEYSRRNMSLKEIRRHIRNADLHFFDNKDDPWPFRNYKLYFIPGTLLRWLHSVRYPESRNK